MKALTRRPDWKQPVQELPRTPEGMEQYIAELKAKHDEYLEFVAWGVRVTTAWARDRMQVQPKLTLIKTKRITK